MNEWNRSTHTPNHRMNTTNMNQIYKKKKQHTKRNNIIQCSVSAAIPFRLILVLSFESNQSVTLQHVMALFWQIDYILINICQQNFRTWMMILSKSMLNNFVFFKIIDKRVKKKTPLRWIINRSNDFLIGLAAISRY